MSNIELDKAYQLISDTNQSIFLTGRAGTGKSTFLRKIRNEIDKRFVVLAPTGIAAINVKGMTIHSFFQFPLRPLLPNDKEIKTFKKNSEKRQLIEKMDVLVIDEISMVRADLLDGIDTALRRNTGNAKIPFGGKQLILIGDLFQLEPVAPVRTGAYDIIFRNYDNAFFFSAYAFKAVDFIGIELKKVYRQEDESFISLLDSVRKMDVDEEELALINNRFDPNISLDDHRFTITLAAINRAVDKVNKAQLARLHSKQIVYHGKVIGDFSPDRFPAEIDLRLKEGAQVIFVKNDTEKRWVNGSIGRINTLDEEFIEVELGTGRIVFVEPVAWENIVFKYDKAEKKIVEEVKGTYTQYPLRLAWSITIHKSQGMTFDDIIIDLGRGAFAGGQTYVALSRCRTLEGIRLKTPIRYKDIFIDPAVIEFAKTLDNNK
ncbi:MAG: DEAD/DEAH box helicase [Bacteroidota bacterium]